MPQQRQEARDNPYSSTEQHEKDAMQKAQDKVAHLRQELQAAELEESVTRTAATTNVLCSDLNPEKCQGEVKPIVRRSHFNS